MGVLTETEPGIVSHKVDLEAAPLQTLVLPSTITNLSAPAITFSAWFITYT